MINAIILAGSQPINDCNDNSNKALLCINGKMMVERVLDAVKSAADIDKVTVAGTKKDLGKYLEGKVDVVIDSQGSIMDHVLAATEYLGVDKNLLVCSSDIPLITKESINDFVGKSKLQEADLYYPVIEKQSNFNIFPENEAATAYIKTREGTFAGGNIFLVNPRVVEKLYPTLDRLIKIKKHPLKLAKTLGPKFIMQTVTGTLTLEGIEKRFSKLLDVKTKLILSCYPEIFNDVDRPSDVLVATAILSR
ncbi:MAG: NTP transferase domain-containing protein [Clostridiales bacterium]|jgi:molybdopterin-guanine dinucleotide biosynthesis protein A|nr:NTP transferase domain-containing protein [Eubacteriales bacterium]MDH7567087.1 NTP transferase domain-containing protein [Clostridiales bacterium]